MADDQRSEAEVAFDELEVVAGAIRRMQKAAPWKADAQRLHRAHGDVTAALAQAAYAGFPDHPRRWDAGAMLLRQHSAFGDATSDAPAQAWQAVKSAVEAEILAAPEAPSDAVAAALEHALRRTNTVSATAGVEALLESFDSLIPQIETRLPDSPLLDRAYSMLIGRLEQLDARAALRTRLEELAAGGNDRSRAFARGRLAALAARETPVDLALEDLSGEPLNIADLRGQVVLLQYWASWCPPCRAEIPHLREAYAAYRDRGFHIVGLSLDKVNDGESLDQARGRVAAFMKDNGMGWRTQFDGSGWNNPFVAQFGVRSIPASLLLDRDGRVAALNPRGEDIAVQVARLLAGRRRHPAQRAFTPT